MPDRLKLTKAQRRILVEARDRGSVDAYMQARRTVERLRAAGFLKKIGLVSHEITPAGRALLYYLATQA